MVLTVYIVMGDDDDNFDTPQTLKVFNRYEDAENYKQHINQNYSSIYSKVWISHAEMDDKW